MKVCGRVELMVTIQNILFPVDFSPSCTAMAPLVKRVATITTARVTLLHVLEPSMSPASGFELYARPLSEAEKDRELTARAKLDSYLLPEFPANHCTRIVLAGDAAARITGVARERGIDLIAMPTHAGVFRRTLLGSTTAKVLNDADCPVLTTQHAETIAPRRLEHREWVCAIGLGPESARVLRYATQITEAFHVNLTLIHAIPGGEPGLPVQLDLEERVQSMEKRAAHERIRELQKAVGSHAPVKIAVGPIKNALIEAARRLQADELVIGRSSEPGSHGRLRDLTYAVVRDAPCPVMSV